MKFSFSHKLFTGFALLSLLTILLGVTSFAIIAEITNNQRNITLLQEFELRINTLETVTNAQGNAAFISAKSYDDFRDNLEQTKQVAKKILHSDYCTSVPTIDSGDSCEAVMLEAIDFYPQAAIEHYEKTLLTLRLINRNHFIYRRMLETVGSLPAEEHKNRTSSIIHQLEILKHELEGTNNFEAIAKMKSRLELLEKIDPGIELLELARIFVSNSDKTYQNRLDIHSRQKNLAQTTERFRTISGDIINTMNEDRSQHESKVRGMVMLLGLCSIAMTLLFWLLTSRRLARFLKHQKSAINSIRMGLYDYPLEKDSNDELNELYLFTKDLANNLREEIAEREYSQQEKKDLRFQLIQAQRLESIGILAGGIAHDFNNILTGITGYTDLALAQLEDSHPIKRYLETIADSSQKAAEMTRQLLVFSRKQETAKKIVDLDALIKNLLKMLNRMIGEDIILEFEASPDLPPIMADPAHMEHVLLNMAVNAKDAMPKGGKLVIRTSKTTLDNETVAGLDGVDPGDFVQISITDTGSGMTREVKEKIFDPFFTTKPSDQGTGLGLATVFGIIKQHNGHITVDSDVGQGTTFTFYLPAIKKEKIDREEAKTGSIKEIAKGRETILLVDDNDTARDFVCETLEYCGYKVLTAAGGNEAIKTMYQTDYPIELLLTDLIMPGMSGTELARTAQKLYPKIKVIFMSGYDDLSADQGLERISSDNDFLKKPMSIETLAKKVRETLDR